MIENLFEHVYVLNNFKQITNLQKMTFRELFSLKSILIYSKNNWTLNQVYIFKETQNKYHTKTD